MSDFRTNLQLVLSELHRKNAEDIDRATISLIDSMAYHKARRYWFNESEVIDAMVQGQQDYAIANSPNTSGSPLNLLPFDWIRPLGMQYKVGQNWYDPMAQEDISYIRTYTYFDGQLGYPDVYAWHDSKIWLYSIPQNPFEWRIDYVRDLNRPRYSHDGTQWVFEEFIFDSPSNTWVWVPLTDIYTNEWLVEADAMIRARALFRLHSRFYNDREKATDFFHDWKDEEERLRTQSAMFESENIQQDSTRL